MYARRPCIGSTFNGMSTRTRPRRPGYVKPAAPALPASQRSSIITWVSNQKLRFDASTRTHRFSISLQFIKPRSLAFAVGYNKSFMLTSSSILLLILDVCGEGFKNKYKLKHHKGIHSGERKFSCEVRRRHEALLCVHFYDLMF